MGHIPEPSGHLNNGGEDQLTNFFSQLTSPTNWNADVNFSGGLGDDPQLQYTEDWLHPAPPVILAHSLNFDLGSSYDQMGGAEHVGDERFGENGLSLIETTSLFQPGPSSHSPIPHTPHQPPQHQHQQQQQQHMGYSDEMLAAANTLTQQQLYRPQNIPIPTGSPHHPAGPSQLQYNTVDQMLDYGRGGNGVQQNQLGTINGGNQPEFSMAWSNLSDVSRLQPHQHQPNSTPRSRVPIDIQFGSDQSFGRGPNYVPPNEKDTSEALSQKQLGALNCLEPLPSAAPTRQSSPAPGQTHGYGPQHNGGTNGGEPGIGGQLQLRTRPNVPLSINIPSGQARAGDADIDEPPGKRRKGSGRSGARSSFAASQDSGREFSPRSASPAASSNRGPFSPAITMPKKQRRNTKVTIVGGSSAPPPIIPDQQQQQQQGPTNARRKSGNSTASKKPPRENLTEAQKRENHIKSEQKRRTLIKDGFNDLETLVPGLKSTGLSKSGILNTAGDYLEQLIKDNAELRARLDALAERFVHVPGGGGANPAAPAAENDPAAPGLDTTMNNGGANGNNENAPPPR